MRSMKIPKLMIIEFASKLIRERGRVSQLEVHTEIERVLNRNLTKREKMRITQVLRNRYVVSQTIIDNKSKRRIEYFE